MIDRDTMLVGLTAIGRLHADSGEALPDSILAAERVVFARQFDPIWCELTNDDIGTARAWRGRPGRKHPRPTAIRAAGNVSGRVGR